ncbi:hypothetical protein EVAR_62389_1 [Eumeta japonica]|uniref:Uncharacterized protein n=1 Tax=Eumeta variegata TaxID=151549 RepID=A0A4C1Z1Y4_EUMVA|nr:hypothetical protein EVAR_62389_1 [Eumeta japonica]
MSRTFELEELFVYLYSLCHQLGDLSPLRGRFLLPSVVYTPPRGVSLRPSSHLLNSYPLHFLFAIPHSPQPMSLVGRPRVFTLSSFGSAIKEEITGCNRFSKFNRAA